MVAPPLVEPYIEEGWKLLEALRAESFDLAAAYWSYLEESDVWHLVLVTQLVDESGPRRHIGVFNPSYVHFASLD